MRIYILDDCEILLLTLALILGQEKEFDVVGWSDSKGDICQSISSSGCDTLLIGLRLRNKSGLEITRQLRALGSNICVIVLGYSNDARSVQEMYQSGADSFISMSTNNQELIDRILVSRRNQSVCDFSITASCDRIQIL